MLIGSGLRFLGKGRVGISYWELDGWLEMKVSTLR